MQRINLSDRFILTLPLMAAGQHLEFADAIVGNVRLVVAGSRKGFFYAPDFTPDKHTHWRRLGWFPDLSTEDARDMASKLNRISARQEDGATGVDVESPSFADACKAYLGYLPSRHHNRSVPIEKKFFRRYLMDSDHNPWACRAK